MPEQTTLQEAQYAAYVEVVQSPYTVMLRTVDFETNVTFGTKTLFQCPMNEYRVLSRINYFSDRPMTYFVSDPLSREDVLRVNEFANLVA